MGRRTISGVIGSLLAAVALSATTAATAGAATILKLEPANGTFGSVKVGNTSPPLALKLTIGCDIVLCSADFNPAPSSSNPEFPVINLCPSEIDIGGVLGFDDPTCYLITSFTPSSAGAKSATISTGAGGPTATLTGTGTVDAAPVVQAAGKCKRGGKKKRSASAAKKKRGCKKRKKKR